MSPTLAELLAALPEGLEEQADPSPALHQMLRDLTRRPVPVGRLNRLWVLGSLPAKMALAYLAWWLRSRYRGGRAARTGAE